MTRGGLDLDALAACTSRALGRVVRIEAARRLPGGASRETWAYEAVDAGGAAEPVGRVGADPPAPAGRERLVLRRDPGSQVGQSDRATESAVLRAARAAGVAVPAVRFVLAPGDGLGEGFVMDLVDGESIPRRILRAAGEAERAALLAQAAAQAARIHRIPPATLPALPVGTPAAQLEQYRALIDALGEPHPAFELALRWLAEHEPAAASSLEGAARPGAGAEAGAGESGPRLVHGDFRLGNFLVGPEGLRAVLDWELCHLGDPIEDLGWMCVRSWRFGEVAREAAGLGSAEELLAAYEGATGRAVALDHLRYWEAFGALKWGVICQMQCATHLQGIVRSVELAALGRRVAEVEADVLDLVT